MIVNMSVWESIDALAAFVYRSGHVDVMRRRREWFESMKPYMVLWWIPAGELRRSRGQDRLEHLRVNGRRPSLHLQGALPVADADAGLVDDDALRRAQRALEAPAARLGRAGRRRPCSRSPRGSALTRRGGSRGRPATCRRPPGRSSQPRPARCAARASRWCSSRT